MSATGSTPKGGHVFDLTVGDSAEVHLVDGSTRRLTLVGVHEPRGKARGLIRFPKVSVDIDGERVEVPAALYHTPQTTGGLRIACSVTRGIVEAVGRHRNVYAMDKDARLRCWPVDGPLFDETPLVYPAKQVWFASMTQMANERCYTDGGELPALDPSKDYVYHHYGLDLGGLDKAVPVVAPRSGTLVCRGEDAVADYDDEAAGQRRYDRVTIRDDTGWYFRYSHLDMIDPGLELGQPVEAGDFLGFLGKEGSSGGWSHLHFSIASPQPSGRYGEVEGYPFLVEAYLHENPGALLPCARPHRVGIVGEPIELDGSRSICDGGEIVAYRWSLQNGESVDGVKATVSYPEEGMYSEMLTVADGQNRTAIDFCVVQILPQDGDPARTPPAMHLASYPTEGVRPGQPIAFKVRTFFKGKFEENNAGEEKWDFGDGTTATTCSSSPGRGSACADADYAERWHAYDRPGRYIVTVRRTGKNGLTATAQIVVQVD